MKANIFVKSMRLVVACALIISALISVNPVFATGAPEIDIYGELKSVSIVDGDTTPSAEDSTDFGDVGTDATSGFYYDICNVNKGSPNLNLSGAPLVELTGDADFSVTIQPASVIGAAHCTNFQITFAPGSLGIKTATVSIANNDADENPYTFVIVGNGVTPAPEMYIRDNKSMPTITNGDTTPSIDDATDFGDVATSSASSIDYEICNDGTTDLNLSGTPLVELTGDSDFSVAQDPTNVIRASHCTNFQITLTPGSLGAKTATVSIANNDADENPYTFAIAGNGIPPAPEMDIISSGKASIENGDTTPSTDDSTDFGDVGTGEIFNSEYYICNDGIGNLNLSGTPLVELTGDSDFSVFHDPASVIGASDCTYFEIVFTPGSEGTKTATVSIANDDADENPYIFVIAGNGVPPVPEMNIHEYWSGLSIADGDNTPLGEDGTDFVDVAIGSPHGVVNYYICNSGSADLHLTGAPLVELTGDADFSVTYDPDNVISISDCTRFQITFSPTSAGVKTAMVSIANEDADENPYDFSIQGTGIGPDSYEDDDDFTNAKPISPKTSQAHNILPLGDWDYMSFTLDHESGVVLTTSGPDDKADTYLDLYDSNQSLIISDDDSGNDLYSRITRTCDADPLPAGTYYVRVSDYGNNETIFDYAFSFAKTTCIKTITLKSADIQDGLILESSETSSIGGTKDSSATTFRLGDDATRKQYRGILSFSTGAALPDTATITSVKLRVRKQGVIGGGNPLTTFQGFMVDIKKGIFGASALQSTDFQAVASKTYGPFSPSLVSSWYSINLTSGKAYINKLSTSGGLTHIRLRFKLDDDNNSVANYLSLYSGNAGAANSPQLVITYTVP